MLPLVRDERIATWSHIDERSAGFFALGLAKATGRAVAIACTSGTAAANLAPAVHEAREAGVPLIVLTADRPPELREVGAGQVIDQVKLFGDAAKWFFEVGNHAATPERIRWMRTLACRAVGTAEGRRPGVVHLNVPLHDPLVPPPGVADRLPPGREAGAPWVERMGDTPALRGAAVVLVHALRGARRGVVIAGRERSPTLERAVPAFAEALRWPALADPLSGARRGSAAIAHYDLLLRDPARLDDLRPDVVVRVGDLPTSKPLRTWLASLDGVRQIAFRAPSVWSDPDGVVDTHIDEDAPLALTTALGALGVGPEAWPFDDMRLERADPSWLESWREADARAAGAIEAVVGDTELSEPQVARELVARLPEEATLWVASSMPIRDVETFAAVRDRPPRVMSNRGANGIDGTVSSAFGAAAAGEGPVVLLIGDVALAHDIGGLLSARRLGLPLTIVLLNNDGGGIFEFLPIAGEADAYERHVATPHGLDFAHASALYGCEHVRPGSLDELRAALDASVASDGTTIIEVTSDRHANRALHRDVADAVPRP